MASPVVADYAAINISTSGSSSQVTFYPGDLCLILFGSDGDNTFKASDCYMGSSATPLHPIDERSFSTDVFAGVLYRWVDGTETDDTVYVAGNENETGRIVILRITGVDTEFAILNHKFNSGEGVSISGDSTLLYMEEVDFLHIGFSVWDHTDTLTSHPPSGWTEYEYWEASGSGGCGLWAGGKSGTAALDAGWAHTLSASEEWVTHSLFIFPGTGHPAEFRWQSAANIQELVGTTSYEQWATKFHVRQAATIGSVEFKWALVGSPSDSMRVSLRSSYDGSDLTYGDATYSTPWQEVEFGTPYEADAGEELWLCFQRTGTLDNSNYYKVYGFLADGSGALEVHKTLKDQRYKVGGSWYQNVDTLLSFCLFEGGTGAQTVYPGLITATPATYAPQVVPGPVAIDVGLVSVTPSVPVPQLNLQVSPGLVSVSPTLYAPEVVPGNVDVSPPLAAVTPNALAPEVIPGPVAIDVPLVSVTPTTQAPTVVPGPVAIDAPLVSVSPSVLVPEAVPGAVAVDIPLVTVTPSVPVPTVLPGGVTVEPGLVTASPQVYAPEVLPGAVAVEVGLISVTPSVPVPTFHLAIDVPLAAVSPTVPTPEVVPGAVTVEPGLVGVTPAAYVPAVQTESYPQDVVPGLIQVSPSVPAPTVEPGPVAIDAPLIQTTPGTYAPEVVPGAVAVDVGLVSVSPTVPVPEVVPGPVAVDVPLIQVTPATPAPTFHLSVEVGLVVVTPTAHIPEVVPGGVAVDAPLITVTPSALVPSVTGEDTAAPPLVAVVPTVFAPSLWQSVNPDDDVTDGGWTNELGSAVDLYASIDEEVPSDSDYCKSSGNPSADMMEVSLGSLVDPLTSDDHKVRYRIGKDDSASTIDITVKLMCGTTTIATWNHYDVALGWTTYEQTLTTGEADAITDYTDLRLRVEADS